MGRTSRVAIVGAGVMGTWTALHLARAGHEVTLLDAHGPGNSLSSSGGETRITRSAHGTDEHYPRWQRRALELWRDLEAESGVQLVHPTGVAWFAHREDGFEADSLAVLQRLGIPASRLSGEDLSGAYPGVSGEGLAWTLLEPEGGALMARRGVAAAAAAAERAGAEVRIGLAVPAASSGEHLASVRVASGAQIGADAFVFAAGPWLPQLFPDLLGPMLAVTRQEVVFFATPPGDDRWDVARCPAWVDYDRAFYGVPSVEGRGFKCAPDWPGPLVDPERQERVIGEEAVDAARGLLRERFPGIADRPVAEGRVCQYESTADAHFIIDRHPAWDNVWVVGGGSGHGFKHGPVIGEYVAALVAGDESATARLAPRDDRFALRPRTAAGGLRTMAARRDAGEATGA